MDGSVKLEKEEECVCVVVGHCEAVRRSKKGEGDTPVLWPYDCVAVLPACPRVPALAWGRG